MSSARDESEIASWRGELGGALGGVLGGAKGNQGWDLGGLKGKRGGNNGIFKWEGKKGIHNNYA